MNLSGSGSVAVYQGDGLTMISMKKRNRQVSVEGSSSTVSGISSDFKPVLWRGEDGNSPGTVIIQAGQVFQRQSAYANADDTPGLEYPATTVTAPAGPTTGYIYLEIPMEALSPVDDDGLGAVQSNVDYFSSDFDLGGTNYYELVAGSGHTSGGIGSIKFYETMQTSTHEYFRKVLSSVVVDGNGGITSVNQIHYGDVFMPYGNIARMFMSVGAA